MVAYQCNEVLLLVTFRKVDGFLNQYFQGTAVVAVTYFGAGIRNGFRFGYQVVFADNFVWIVDVQLEVRHDGKMIPQLVLEIGYVAKVGKHVSHDVDNGICTTLALGAVFDCQCMVYHILDAAPVFGQRHPLLLSIILHIL